MKKLLLISLLLMFCLAVKGQVTVAPVTVHLSDADRNGYILVRNNSNSASWEVSIDMKFGYPVSDSSGKTIIHFPDTESETDPSAVKFISFYPRKFILSPLGEQTVRIAAKPKNLKDGEYWGRPVIKSKQVVLNDSAGKENIDAGLGVEFRSVIALNYRRGKVSTGINFSNLTCSYNGSKIVLFAELKREGNAAYIGNIVSALTNEKSEVIKSVSQEISVYYELNKRVEIETGNLAPGKYTITVQVNTDREETGGNILKGNAAERTITLSIEK